MMHLTKIALCSAAFLLACGSAWSQDQPTQRTRLTASPSSYWPAGPIYKGDHFMVVTTADPLKRQPCKVKSVSVDELVCSGAFGHTRSFHKNDVAALIELRKSRESRGTIVAGSILTAIGGAIFYGAICVATIAAPYIALAIPIALAGGVIGVGSLAITLDLASELTTETLLYQQPGQALQVSLRN